MAFPFSGLDILAIKAYILPMKFDFNHWFGQVTTGGGIAALLAALTAIASHTVTWQQGLIPLVGAAYLIIHPEDTKGEAVVQKSVSDAEKMVPTVVADSNAIISAFKAGLTHGMTMATPAPATPATT